MATTFGMCGPLDLSPNQAVATDSFYNGGFMCGRLTSAVIAGFLIPRNMILISLVNCVLAAGLLCLLAGTSMYGLYIGTAWIGFFVSWQFGAAFSWVAAKVNITGYLSSIFFVACGFGGMATPPLSGYIFTSRLSAYLLYNNPPSKDPTPYIIQPSTLLTVFYISTQPYIKLANIIK